MINAYLGDLLYHTNRFEDAEPYLGKAIALDPDSTMATTALGMVKFHRNHFAEAERLTRHQTSDRACRCRMNI